MPQEARLVHCYAAVIVLNSGRWRCLSKRGTTRVILPLCAACIANASSSCGKRWRQSLLTLMKYQAARGLHLTVVVEDVDDEAIVQQARRFQLAPGALSRFYLNEKRREAALFWATVIRPHHAFLLRYGRWIALLRSTDAGKGKDIVK